MSLLPTKEEQELYARSVEQRSGEAARSAAREAPSLPPSTNRGVVCREVFASMDWCRASKPRVRQGFKELVAAVGKWAETNWLKTSALFGHGYSGVDLAVHGSITWRQSRSDDGKRVLDDTYDVIVDLTAEALEYVRNSKGYTDDGICAFLLDLGFRGTCIDAALDVPDKKVTPRKVYKWLDAKKDLYACESRQRSWVESDVIRSSEPLGATCYIGSRGRSAKGQSTRFARVYDKVLEYAGKKGVALVFDDGEPVKHLTRFELRHNDEAAAFAMEYIAAKGREGLKDLWRGWIDFKCARQRKKYKNKKHCPSASWWLGIVGEGVKLKPGLKRASTPEKSRKWLIDAVACTVKLDQQYGNPAEFQKAVDEAQPSEKKELQWKEYFERKRAEECQKSGVLFEPSTVLATVRGRGDYVRPERKPAKQQSSTSAAVRHLLGKPLKAGWVHEGEWAETKKRLEAIKRDCERAQKFLSEDCQTN